MRNYIIRRLLLAVLTISVISFFSFVIISLPGGDYVDRYIQELELAGDYMSDEAADAIRDYYGLDRSIVVQYWRWISRIVFKQDFGFSFRHHRDIKGMIGDPPCRHHSADVIHNRFKRGCSRYPLGSTLPSATTP